ncbi:MAG TPA: polysaccharide deacetylase family protein, partial [Thermoleophilaceae bacterium]
MSTPIPILLYHSVSDRPDPRDRRWTVGVADFAAHARAVAASGRIAMTVTEIAEALRGGRPLPERPVGITFDDGFSDTYEAVVALEARGLVSTVYVTSGEVGRSDRLTPAQLSEVAHGTSVELGAHAVRHRRLDELDGRGLTAEVEGSRVELEELVQAPVRSFAY